MRLQYKIKSGFPLKLKFKRLINITTEVFHMFPLMRLSRQCHAAFIFLWLCSVYVPSGAGSQRRSISMPVCLFKESVHGLVCCAASGINSTEIGAHFYYGLCAISLLLLRLVCIIPSSSIISGHTIWFL